jgi:cobalamin transport system substrate-binding protein
MGAAADERSTSLSRRALIVAALVTACGRRAAPAPGARVVSLSPSTTEAMFALGLGDLVVGRSQQCDRPPEVARLPSVGGFADPNVEAILSLRPTLVVGARGPAGPELERELHVHGLDTFFPAGDTLADYRAMLVDLGSRFGAGDRARALVEAIDARVARIREWAARRPPVRTVMVFDASPVFVAGPGTFPDELLALAGGKNVIDRGGQWPTIDLERLLVLDPAVVIDATGGGHGDATLARAPGWAEIPAVREGRLRPLRSDAALRPGPRTAEGLADVAFALHGEEPP